MPSSARTAARPARTAARAPRRAANRLPPSLVWNGGLEDGRLAILDQRRLPECVQAHVATAGDVAEAILGGAVSGITAPTLAAAYGLALGLIPTALKKPGKRSGVLRPAFAKTFAMLGAIVPPGSLDRCRDCFDRHESHLTAIEMCARLLMEAKRMHREDEQLCRRIAEHGAAALGDGGAVLLHGYGGSLATGGDGTAIAALIQAVRSGADLTVAVTETRPSLDGARLAQPELLGAGIDANLVCDAEAAGLISRGEVTAVLVAAEAVTAAGEVFAPVGTHGLAQLARLHRVPFVVAAPSTVFLAGAQDDVEYDRTPIALVGRLVTDRGVLRDPTPAALQRLLATEAGEPAV